MIYTKEKQMDQRGKLPDVGDCSFLWMPNLMKQVTRFPACDINQHENLI